MEFKLTSKRDPSGFLKLSKSQEKSLLEWQRPHEFLEYPQLFDDGDGGMYLVQDIITDCSLVASLCAAAAWEVTHQEKVFSLIISNEARDEECIPLERQ
jgi:calpain-7